MGLSSNILWHQTNEEGFYEILNSKKLRYSYSLERIIPMFKLKPVAFPMISVSDYPFSEIGNNKWAYGDFCIGFNQKWGEKVGFSPVSYCSYGSRSLQQINNLLDEAIKTDSQKLFGLAMFLFSHMKFVEAPLKTKKKLFEKYRFFDEREWRVVPYITETDNDGIMPFLTEDGYKEYKENNNGKSLLKIGVDFQYDDIHYIIVETKEDVQKTIDIVGTGIHVFTKDEIIEDVIGVDHHEEIKPSQEQMDLEAGLRHIERFRNKFLEYREKWETEKNGK